MDVDTMKLFLIHKPQTTNNMKTKKKMLVGMLAMLSFSLLFHLQLSSQTPEFQWAKGLRGIANGMGSITQGVVSDMDGGVYITGSFYGTVDFNSSHLGGAVPNNISSNPLTFPDVYLAKYDADGDNLWAKGFGGTESDNGQTIGMDADGNIYISGTYTGTANFDGFSLQAPGPLGYFFAKFDGEGNCLWAVDLAQTQSSLVVESAYTDNNGNTFLTGYFYESALFGDINLVSAGNADIFVVKVDSSGDVLWAKGMGGSSNDRSKGISSDQAGHIYIAGSHANNATFCDITITDFAGFVLKMDQEGNCIDLFNIGAGAYDVSVSLDGDGQIFVGASFVNQVVVGDQTLVSAGGSDMYVARFEADGTLQWVKQIGGPEWGDAAKAIATGSDGLVFFTGQYQGAVQFGDILLETPNADFANIFFAILNAQGEILAAEGMSSQTSDTPHTLYVNSGGSVFLAGSFNGTTQFNSIPLHSIAMDGFFMKYGEEVTSTAETGFVANAEISVFPNPASDLINISFSLDSGMDQSLVVSITDLSGRTVLKEQFHNLGNPLHIGHLKPGMYIVHIVGSDKQGAAKLLKK
jgi:hypothetical protein